jgi:AsmA protein
MPDNLENAETRRAGARGVWGKLWVKIVGGIIIAILIILFIVPLFINGDTFRPTAEAQISNALGRKVTLGHLNFSLWSGSLVADNVSIADDPAYSTNPFFQAKSLHIGVSVPALMFHHQVRIDKLRANSPQIQLIQKTDGQWNFSSLGQNGKSANGQKGGTPDVSIGELLIRNGKVLVSSPPVTSKPFVYSNVDLTVHHVSYTTPMEFQMTADLPGDGSLKLDGTAGPVAQPNAVNTPLNASLEVKHFDPVATGAVTPAEGVSMIADIHGKVVSDGKTLKATGQIAAKDLKLSPHGSPAPHPVNVDFAIMSDLGARTGRVSDIAIHTASVAAHLTGTYQMTDQAVALNLRLSAPRLPVDGVEELLPAVGVKLPSGSSLKGGTITANLAITGPASAVRIMGPVDVENTRLAGFDLGSKINGLASLGKGGLGGSGGGTAIRTLRTDVDSTSQSTDLENIFADVPAIGTATGHGTVAASGAINFKMLAKLNTSGSVGKAMDSAMVKLGGVAGKVLHTAASDGIPLTIAGTTSDPVIRADVGAMLKPKGSEFAGQNADPKKKAGSLLKGLLGR